MSTVQDIFLFLDRKAPFAAQESWDNSGLLVQAHGGEVEFALLALDITAEVVREAHEKGAGLIIAHHPVIFHPIKRIAAQEPVYLLAQYGISAICAHTNLDVAQNGVNDALAARLQLQNIQPLCPPGPQGLALGRIGDLRLPCEAEIYLRFIKKNLQCRGIKYTAGKRRLQRVAVCGGAGADLVGRAAQLGADALVTADSKHNLLLEARALGIMLIDAGHYATERVVLEPLADALRGAFAHIRFECAQQEEDPAFFLI